MDRIALVTGGSRGIGFAVARKLHEHGWRVALTSRDIARAEEAAADIASDVLPIEYDAKQDANDAVRRVQQEMGMISSLINVAGISKDNLLLRLPPDELDQVLHTNLVAPIHMTRAVVKGMIRQKAGSIVNIGSVVGSSGNAGQTAYSASKAGLVGFTKSLAKELGPRNIRVNVVEPGYISTDMTQDLDTSDRIALGRMGQPEEVSELVAFLASDKASYITGQAFRIDGGLSI